MLSTLTQATRDTDGNDRRSPATRKRETADALSDAYAELYEFLDGESLVGDFRIR
jgi:hypothetical protein